MIRRQIATTSAVRSRDAAAAAAKPSDTASWSSGNQSIRRYILRHQRGCADQRPSADRDVRQNRRARAHRCAVFDRDGAALPLLLGQHAKLRIRGSRAFVVGKDSERPDEDAAADAQTSVEAGVILNLAVIADDDVAIDEDAFADDAAFTDACAAANLRFIPDAGAGADFGAVF